MATILCLDDPDEAKLFVRILSACGHTCLHFNSAHEALRQVMNDRPDLVVLNPHLPDGEGIRALEAMKEFDPDLFVVLYTDASLYGDSCDYFIADSTLVKHPEHTQLLAFVKTKFDYDIPHNAVPFHECFF